MYICKICGKECKDGRTLSGHVLRIHKISKLYGFNNNISPEEIGSLSNLCITTRSTNSSKNYRTEEEYLKFLQNKQRLERL